MAQEIRVPSLGESIVEATVAKWLKQVGEAVAEGEPVVELETDKVNLEVAAEHSGVLAGISSDEGAVVAIGDLLGTIDEQAAAAAPPQPTAAPDERERAPAPATAHEEKPQPVAPAGNGHHAQPTTSGEIVVSPVAQRVAAENNVDLKTVTGTGPGGRITKEDVLRSAGRPSESAGGVAATPVAPAPSPTAAPPPKAPASPTPEPYPTRVPAMERPMPPRPPAQVHPAEPGRQEERQRMSRRRQTIARRLVEAQQTAAMLTTFNEADMSAIMAVRKRRRDSFKERHGIGLGFMSFFARAVVGALKSFPLLNAEIQGDEIVVKHYYDLGIAVGTDEGLVVPVVRDADRKSFAAIEQEIADLAGRARAGSLTLNELQGGTFTITNGGIYGSLMSTPILNTPQVGILGMHKIEERPVVVDGQIVVRPMMYLALSYDHRIVDGSEAVRFLVRIKELLEDPEALLLEG